MRSRCGKGGINGLDELSRDFELNGQKLACPPVILCAIVGAIVVGRCVQKAVNLVHDVNSVLEIDIKPQIVNGLQANVYTNKFTNAEKYIVFT